jgi:hypothetical protein
VAEVHVAEGIEELGAVVGAWDRLAKRERRPLARPDRLLTWWWERGRSVRARSELRVAAVVDAKGLAAVAPSFVEDAWASLPHLRFLGWDAFWGARWCELM